MRFMHPHITTALLAVLVSFALPALAGDFVTLDHFPAPAPDAYGVTGTALNDGTLLLWNGDALFRQAAPGLDRFVQVAEGYAGDPGFAALSPDGALVILGQGYAGNLYAFDPAQPADFAPSAIRANQSHFAGVFLTNTLLLLDAGTPDWNSELLIIDVSGAKKAPRTVVTKSARFAIDKQSVVGKPGYSSALTVDAVHGLVYAMGGQTRELRFFVKQDLIDAYQGNTTLDWETDGTLVGQAGDFFGAGVNGITAQGQLIISGSNGWGEPGGIQIVDPRLDDPTQAGIVETLDPTGVQGYVKAIYNPITGAILAVDAGSTAYVQSDYLVAAASLADFPAHPGGNGFSVVADFAGDGRIVAWDGNALWLQRAPGADQFDQVTTNVPGDPAFIQVAPNGTRVLLGAGGFGQALYLGDIYEFNLAQKALPVVVNTDNHFWADFVDNDTLLVNRVMPGNAGSEGELVLVDLAAHPMTVTPVLQHIPAYSAAFAVDRANGLLYAAYSDFSAGGPVRRFDLPAVVAATGSPLNWTSGMEVGVFDNGPAAVTDRGLLLVPGFNAKFQVVDPTLGVILTEMNPANLAFGGYTVAYSTTLNLILAVSNDFGGNFGLWLVTPPDLGAGDGCDVLCQNPDADADGDGLPYCMECNLGTDWRLADTDGDGVNDGDEIANGSDPLDPGEAFRLPTLSTVGLALLALMLALAAFTALRPRAA